MARTELQNGVILPAEYSDDWYEDMTSNLTKLDDVIGSDSEKLNADGVYFLRMSSAALTDSGTGNFSDLNSSYKIKTGDLVLDSGRKLYRIVSVDSTNETFTVGNSLFKVTAESDLALVAESGDYGDLDNKPDLNPYNQHLANTDIHVTTADKTKWNNGVTQSYVFRYSSTALVASSTNSNTLLDNTDNLKVGDKVIDASGVIYSVTAIDTANSTFTIGTALIDLALDANVVHTSGNETIGGEKTFSDYLGTPMLTATGKFITDEGSNHRRTVLKLLAGARDTDGYSCSYITRVRPNKAQGTLISSDVQTLGFDFVENQVRTLNTFVIRATNWLNDAPQKIEFTSNITDYTYGSSTNKAKINDLNPGSLSLPDLSNGIDISGYLNTGASTNDTYTALADGYISIILSSSTACGCYVYNYSDGIFQRSNSITDSTYSNVCGVFMPIMKNQTLNIASRATDNIVSAKFFPCLGNV